MVDRMAQVRVQQQAARAHAERDGVPVLDILDELVRSVAQATAELCAREYDGGAEMWAERQQIALAVLCATRGEAREDPEAPYTLVRRMLTTAGAAPRVGVHSYCPVHGRHDGIHCRECLAT